MSVRLYLWEAQHLKVNVCVCECGGIIKWWMTSVLWLCVYLVIISTTISWWHHHWWWFVFMHALVCVPLIIIIGHHTNWPVLVLFFSRCWKVFCTGASLFLSLSLSLPFLHWPIINNLFLHIFSIYLPPSCTSHPHVNPPYVNLHTHANICCWNILRWIWERER